LPALQSRIDRDRRSLYWLKEQATQLLLELWLGSALPPKEATRALELKQRSDHRAGLLAEMKDSRNYSGLPCSVILFELSTIRKKEHKLPLKARRVFVWSRFSFKLTKPFIELGWRVQAMVTGREQQPCN
jgi:hypothetical protein